MQENRLAKAEAQLTARQRVLAWMHRRQQLGGFVQMVTSKGYYESPSGTPYSLSSLKLSDSGAKASPETVRLAQLGLWRADCVYFHANPDKAAELGRNGGRHRPFADKKKREKKAPHSLAPTRRLTGSICDAQHRPVQARFRSGQAFLARVCWCIRYPLRRTTSAD